MQHAQQENNFRADSEIKSPSKIHASTKESLLEDSFGRPYEMR